jgi:hypothetical protein
MNVELPYADGTLTASLPAGTRRLSSEAATALPPLADLDGAVRAALASPLGLPRIRDLVRPGGRVTIAFDDHTTGSFGPIRPVAIRAVLDELAAAGVSAAQVRLVCANALHRMLRTAELRRLLDDALMRDFAGRLSCHDAEDLEQIVDLGVTAEHGYPVEVSRLVTDADLTVYVNTNYIRGFTGGWKSVCIGLSTWTSIRVTHDPDGMSMSLTRNRMHAVLDEMGHHLEQRLGRRIFKLDTVLADPFHASHVFAGGVDETRRAALGVQAARFPARRDAAPEPCDVLVYGVPDSSPYAIWASVNPILTLISMGLGYLGGMIEAAGKPGCTVVMATAARESWDAVHHPAYRERVGACATADARPLRDHRTLRGGVRAPPGLRRRLSAPVRVPSDPRHSRDAPTQTAPPRGPCDRGRRARRPRPPPPGLRGRRLGGGRRGPRAHDSRPRGGRGRRGAAADAGGSRPRRLTQVARAGWTSSSVMSSGSHK